MTVHLQPGQTLRRYVTIGQQTYRLELTDSHLTIVPKGHKTPHDVLWSELLEMVPLGFASRKSAFESAFDADWIPRKKDRVWVKQGVGLGVASAEVIGEAQQDAFLKCRLFRIWTGRKFAVVRHDQIRPKRGGRR
jgi:hypothetical protein